MNKTEAKKIVSIVLNVLVWAFLVFATLVTILTFVSVNAKDGIPEIFGKSYVSVQSNSMNGDKPGSFKQGDLLIVDKVTEDEAMALDVDDIVVFLVDLNGDGKEELNTHRIVEKIPPATENGFYTFITKGDANSHEDKVIKHRDILAVYDGHSRLAGVGYAIDFMQSSLGFFLIVVLPMALFFLYEVYNLIKIIMEQKVQKAKATVSAEAEEEIKRRAIEEYLAKQAGKNDNE